MCPSYGDTTSFTCYYARHDENMIIYATWEKNFPLWRSFLCGRYLVGGLIFQDISFLKSKYDIRYHGTPAHFFSSKQSHKTSDANTEGGKLQFIIRYVFFY